MAELDAVLIVGGGIAGLTLAAALEQRGFSVDLVERNPVWRTDGAGIAVQANGARVLRRLGMEDAARESGAVLLRWAFSDHRGDLLCETDLQDLWGEAGPCIGVARARLQEVLVRGASGARVRLATSITTLVQHGTRVATTFSDGSTGEYDLVVGADGIHSTVRDLALAPVVPTFAGRPLLHADGARRHWRPAGATHPGAGPQASQP